MGFEKIKEDLMKAGKVVSENANVATSIASAKIKLKEKNDMLNKEYAIIGKKYYEDSKTKTKKEFESINALLKEVEKLEKEVSGLQDSKVCSSCGTVGEKGTFCANCGSKI